MPKPCNSCTFGAHPQQYPLLGGSWVVISRVIRRATVVIRGLMTPDITTHEPESISAPRELVASGGLF